MVNTMVYQIKERPRRRVTVSPIVPTYNNILHIILSPVKRFCNNVNVYIFWFFIQKKNHNKSYDIYRYTQHCDIVLSFNLLIKKKKKNYYLSSPSHYFFSIYTYIYIQYTYLLYWNTYVKMHLSLYLFWWIDFL